MARRYLQHIRVERYGGLSERMVGSFSEGLNVVYGPNEAGKSTLSSLVGGVLFGWEGAHGVRNTYRPAQGGRAGSLEWAPRAAGGEFAQAPGEAAGAPDGALVVRRDEEGVTGDVSIASDIDRATYDALFSLKADELRALRTSTDMTARLLSAGSGTSTSPSAAFVQVEQRIVTATADVLQLGEQLEQARALVKESAEREELLVQEDRELRELAASRATTSQRIEALNAEVENLVAWRAELESIDRRIDEARGELAGVQSELDELAAAGAGASGASGASGTAGSNALDERLLALDSAEERVLRDRLDELAEQHDKLERVADIAKDNAASSAAAYEALMELSDEEVAAARSLRNRTSQAVVSVLLPIAFIAAGIPLFVHGREIASLSFTALGAGLIVIAAFLAAAAFFVLFRPPRETGALESRRQDAQWVMLQDRKKSDATLLEMKEFEAQVAHFFDEVGLSGANGSVRQARTLLDEAAVRRGELAAAAQKASSLDLRARAVKQDLNDLACARARIFDSAGIPVPAGVDTLATSRELDALVRSRSSQRDALLEAADEMSQRFGELSRELSAARTDRSFDEVKLEYHQIRTRLRDRKHDLMELLLAKRMLERSITAWESQSQPEVYEQAGRLLALITDGRWVKVATSPSGSLVAVAHDGAARDPRHLSLGTCQQLYLALRIALLQVAVDVGREIPILADDILVNFDAARRAGAARALEDLARTRQVILFTCHAEVAALFPNATHINL